MPVNESLEACKGFIVSNRILETCAGAYSAVEGKPLVVNKKLMANITRDRLRWANIAVPCIEACKHVEYLYESLYESQGAFPNAMDLNRFFIAVGNTACEALDLPRDQHPQFREAMTALTNLDERIRARQVVPREDATSTTHLAVGTRLRHPSGLVTRVARIEDGRAWYDDEYNGNAALTAINEHVRAGRIQVLPQEE